jgi:ribonucleoside-triphosphate reductase (formate)
MEEKKKVKKRDGSYEEFDSEKIVDAVKKAFESVGSEFSDELAEKLRHFYLYDGEDSVEEIQNQLEYYLMENKYFNEAKAYMLYREHHKQIRDYTQKKLDFIQKFKDSDNTANATIDDNSNVSTHNVAVMNSEIHKEENIEINLRLWENKLKELYPEFDYKQMRKDFNTIMYAHDLSSQVGMPYCVAITLYPFLLNGIKEIGGLSAKPKNIDSFCGMFVNLVFAIASQYKGAVATPGLFVIMDYFCRLEWGDEYYRNSDMVYNSSRRVLTVNQQIHQYFQQICYSLMQPSGSRGNQSVFWNCSIFDKLFFDAMYGEFYYPDGKKPQWESVNWLQKNFMHWLNQERLRCVLTFPVVSLCLIYQDDDFLDKELYEFACQEYAEGNSFFTYISDSADSLSSCCRLSSKIDKPQFSFTNGQLSEMTGSKNVITLNLNRIVQNWKRQQEKSINRLNIKEYLEPILERVYKYHHAYNECLKDLQAAHMLTVYDAGFISMKKQYLTIGLNGLNQAAEFLGIQVSDNDNYERLCNTIFYTIKEANAKHKTKELMYNTECTPCESAAIKLYDRDKRDGYWVPEDTNLYASYIFKPNDPTLTIFDKLRMHGNDYIGDYLDGGSACHINLESHLDKSQYKAILLYAAQVGCKYFTFNVPNCECEDCHFIAKQPFTKCPKCGSERVSLWDRIIGYLTKVKNWSKGRQIEFKTRVRNIL